MKKTSHTGKPFFTLFLEAQKREEQEKLTEAEKESLKGGFPLSGTLKYPSDRDEDADPR